MIVTGAFCLYPGFNFDVFRMQELCKIKAVNLLFIKRSKCDY